MTTPPTIGLVVPDGVPHTIDDNLDVPTIVRRAMAPVVDLAARRRQAIPTVTDAMIAAVTGPQVSPDAARLLQRAVDLAREEIGDTSGDHVQVEAVPTGDGRATIIVVLTFDVARLNEGAMWRGSPVGARRVLDELPRDTWATIAPGDPRDEALRWLKGKGLAFNVGNTWRRR